MTNKTSSFQPPPLSNETIEIRLETGAHGSRASLTKCAVRYRTFLKSTRAKEPNAQDIEEAKQSLETELQLYKVEFTKLALGVTACQQDVVDLETESQDMKNEIASKKQKVESLREQVKKSKQVWGYKEEYESLAKLANHRPSRAILEKRLLLAQKQMQLANQTQERLQQELEMRQKQFTTLMQCMLDLKACVHEEEEEESSTAAQGKDEEEDEEEGVISMDTSI